MPATRAALMIGRILGRHMTENVTPPAGRTAWRSPQRNARADFGRAVEPGRGGAQDRLDALTDPPAVGAPRLGIAAVRRIVHALAAARALDSRDAAAAH